MNHQIRILWKLGLEIPKNPLPKLKSHNYKGSYKLNDILGRECIVCILRNLTN